jgi:glycosyltransferase involved in cell wall biosynthesis
VRITIVATSTRARGAETEALQLGQRLRDLGIDCVNVALAPGDGPADSPVRTLGKTPLGVDTLRALRRETKRSDVVVAYGSSTLPACALALAGSGTPFVYRSIGDPRAWVGGELHRRRTGLLFRRAACVVALWDRAGRDIVDLYGVAPSRVTSIPNARDPDEFRPPTKNERASARADLGLAPNERVVVILGALEPEKRVDLAIRTMAMLPDAMLLVVGDGSRRSELERLAGSLPSSRVQFLGHVSDPRSVMHAGDVLLLTSSTEGMPGVVLEAGLCGLPVVATNVGMVDEMVLNGSTGFVVESDSVDDLAGATRQALEHRVDLGRSARVDMSGRFGWDHALPAWSTLLSDAARNPRARPAG